MVETSCAYGIGFLEGGNDAEWCPPEDPGERWDYTNGYIDSTKNRRVNIGGHEDWERAAIARRALRNRRESEMTKRAVNRHG